MFDDCQLSVYNFETIHISSFQKMNLLFIFMTTVSKKAQILQVFINENQAQAFSFKGCWDTWSRCSRWSNGATGYLWQSCPQRCQCKGYAGGNCRETSNNGCWNGKTGIVLKIFSSITPQSTVNACFNGSHSKNFQQHLVSIPMSVLRFSQWT